jgi:hypothetical protein
MAAAWCLVSSAAWAQHARTQPADPVLLVRSSEPAICALQGGPVGPSPLVVRIRPGSHRLVCTARIDGVVVRREATVQVPPGRNVSVLVNMLGERSR